MIEHLQRTSLTGKLHFSSDRRQTIAAHCRRRAVEDTQCLITLEAYHSLANQLLKHSTDADNSTMTSQRRGKYAMFDGVRLIPLAGN